MMECRGRNKNEATLWNETGHVAKCMTQEYMMNNDYKLQSATGVQKWHGLIKLYNYHH